MKERVPVSWEMQGFGSIYRGSWRGLAELHTFFFLIVKTNNVPYKQFRKYCWHTLGVFLSVLLHSANKYIYFTFAYLEIKAFHRACGLEAGRGRCYAVRRGYEAGLLSGASKPPL